MNLLFAQVRALVNVYAHTTGPGDNISTKSCIASVIRSMEPDVSPRLADHLSHQPRKSQQKVTIVSHHAPARATAYRNVKTQVELYHQPKSHRLELSLILDVPKNHPQRPTRTTCIPRLSEERFVEMVV